MLGVHSQTLWGLLAQGRNAIVAIAVATSHGQASLSGTSAEVMQVIMIFLFSLIKRYMLGGFLCAHVLLAAKSLRTQ